MAFVKLAAGLSDISGKFGGQVFARDKSGLHLRVNPKQKAPQPTIPQKEQRNWYTSIKYAERINPMPPGPFERPRDPHEIGIYGLSRFYGERKTSIGQIPPGDAVYATVWNSDAMKFYARYYRQIAQATHEVEGWTYEYITQMHPEMATKWGYSNFEIATVLDSFFKIRYTFYKDDFDTARTKAIEWFEKGLEEGRKTYTRKTMPKGWSNIEGYANAAVVAYGILGLYILAIVTDAGPGNEGYVQFYRRRVLIQIGDLMVFGSLLGRPSYNCLDFIIVGGPAMPSYTITEMQQGGKTFGYTIDPQATVTINYQHTSHYSSILWKGAETRWAGVAQQIGTNIFRMAANPLTMPYFGVEVGQYYGVSDYFDYPSKFGEYFALTNEPHAFL